VISDILFFPLSRKYGHLLSLDLPESKITTTTTDKSLNSNYKANYTLNNWALHGV